MTLPPGFLWDEYSATLQVWQTKLTGGCSVQCHKNDTSADSRQIDIAGIFMNRVSDC